MKSPIKAVLLTLGFIVLSLCCFSRSLPFRAYSEKDGLPSAFVWHLTQDSRGFLWFCTSRGLSRFDGLEFKNYTKSMGLPHSIIRQVVEDGDNNIWVSGARGGVSRYHFKHSKRFQVENSFSHQSITINTLYAGKNGIFTLGTDKGLYYLQKRGFAADTQAPGLANESIRHIAHDRDGRMWLATANGVVCLEANKEQPGKNTREVTRYTVKHGLVHNQCRFLLPERDGTLWIATIKGLSRFKDGRFTNYTTGNGLSHDYVSCVLRASNGSLWCGTWNGINVLSRGKFSNLTADAGLPGNLIYSMINDKEGNTWVGTNEGVIRLPRTGIVTFSEKDGLVKNGVISITRDKNGAYWFGTGDGLSRYKNGRFKSYTKSDGMLSNTINHVMADRHGRIWAVTIEGLSILDNNRFINYTERDGLPTNILFTSRETRDGAVWIGHRKGISGLIEGKPVPPPFEKDVGAVLFMYSDREGNLWFSSKIGLCKYDFSRSKLTCYTTRDGLAGDNATTFLQDRSGKMWIGTEDGLSLFHEGKFTNYTINDGMPDNTCNFILEDSRRNLWIGTANGLSCFNGKAFKNYKRRTHGLAADYWYSGLKDEHGVFWLGCAYGITRFTPPPFKLNNIAPPVHITRVLVMDKEADLPGLSQLPYDHNYFRFNYVGICTSAPESVVYRYRLKGIDSYWRETRDRTVSYSYLPPGDYKFMVKAVNNDGVESFSTADVPFSIRPPFWKTWWFYSLAAFFVLSMAGLWVLWKIKRVKERVNYEAMLRQMAITQKVELLGVLAAGAVHDLKNLLSAIIGYSQIAAAEKSENDSRSTYIDKIKRTASTAVQMVRQILNFTRSKPETTTESDLTGLVREILDILEVLRPPNVDIQWTPPVKKIFFPIHPERFQQLIMNLCLNAIQAMPKGGKLDIRLTEKSTREETSQLLLEIADTGTGMRPETLQKIFDPLFTTKDQGKGTGLGLFVVRQIVEDYNGKIAVDSKPGEGTTFSIVLPFGSN